MIKMYTIRGLVFTLTFFFCFILGANDFQLQEIETTCNQAVNLYNECERMSAVSSPCQLDGETVDLIRVAAHGAAQCSHPSVNSQHTWFNNKVDELQAEAEAKITEDLSPVEKLARQQQGKSEELAEKARQEAEEKARLEKLAKAKKAKAIDLAKVDEKDKENETDIEPGETEEELVGDEPVDDPVVTDDQDEPPFDLASTAANVLGGLGGLGSGDSVGARGGFSGGSNRLGGLSTSAPIGAGGGGSSEVTGGGAGVADYSAGRINPPSPTDDIGRLGLTRAELGRPDRREQQQQPTPPPQNQPPQAAIAAAPTGARGGGSGGGGGYGRSSLSTTLGALSAAATKSTSGKIMGLPQGTGIKSKKKNYRARRKPPKAKVDRSAQALAHLMRRYKSGGGTKLAFGQGSSYVNRDEYDGRSARDMVFKNVEVFFEKQDRSVASEVDLSSFK